MKIIKIGTGRRKTKILEAYVDDCDFEDLNQYTWSCSHGYAYRHIDMHKNLKMHRQILKAPEGSFVDHKNGNKLDNRRENIRFCTKRQNAQNMKRTSKLGYPGVCYEEGRKKFRAQIRDENGKKKNLGRFNTLDEATKAYLLASQKFHGEFSIKSRQQ